MASRAKRYEGEAKLNVKKLIAVIILIIVIVMFVMGIKVLLGEHSNSTSGKVEVLTYYTIYEGGKWGVINSRGETVINLDYDEMIVIPDNTKPLFVCTYDVDYSNETYKTKVINDKGKEIVEGYDTVEPIINYNENLELWYEEGVLKVKKEEKYGLVDFSGKELLECKYDDIQGVQGIENSLLLLKDTKYGLCDDLGNIIIDTKYKKIEKIEDNYKNGYIVVDENNKHGIIGIDKSVILKCDYEDVKAIYSTNHYIVKQGGKYQVINKEGKVVLQDKFDDALDINGDYIIAKKGGKVGIIDIYGETKVNFQYDDLKEGPSNNYIAKKRR